VKKRVAEYIGMCFVIIAGLSLLSYFISGNGILLWIFGVAGATAFLIAVIPDIRRQ
jgi:hypothetical protein